MKSPETMTRAELIQIYHGHVAMIHSLQATVRTLEAKTERKTKP